MVGKDERNHLKEMNARDQRKKVDHVQVGGLSLYCSMASFKGLYGIPPIANSFAN